MSTKYRLPVELQIELIMVAIAAAGQGFMDVHMQSHASEYGCAYTSVHIDVRGRKNARRVWAELARITESLPSSYAVAFHTLYGFDFETMQDKAHTFHALSVKSEVHSLDHYLSFMVDRKH